MTAHWQPQMVHHCDYFLNEMRRGSSKVSFEPNQTPTMVLFYENGSWFLFCYFRKNALS